MYCTYGKKKRCEIRFGVVFSIDQIGRAHRNRYKYYYFPGGNCSLNDEAPFSEKRVRQRFVCFINNDLYMPGTREILLFKISIRLYFRNNFVNYY